MSKAQDLTSLLEQQEITIKYSREWNEYGVPGLVDGKPSYEDRYVYYTNDKEDAEGTAQHIFGKDVVIKHRKVS
jgi:hypothetical protein